MANNILNPSSSLVLIARVDAMPMEMYSLGNCTYQGKYSGERMADLRQIYSELKQEEGRLWLEADPRRQQYLAEKQQRVAWENAKAIKQSEQADQALVEGTDLALQDIVDAVCPLASTQTDSREEEDEDPLFKGKRGEFFKNRMAGQSFSGSTPLGAGQPFSGAQIQTLMVQWMRATSMPSRFANAGSPSTLQ